MKKTNWRSANLVMMILIVCLTFASCTGQSGSAGSKDQAGSKTDNAAASTSPDKDAASEADSKTEPLALEHDTEFGGVVIKVTEDELKAKGFKIGDSVDVTFSNGYSLQDIPYYSGYYVTPGNPLLIAYPGADFVEVKINYGDDLWETAKVTDKDTASISRHESGKYLSIQNAMDIAYKDDRSAYESDEVFANFRSITAGKIKKGRLYRGASPCDNKYARAPYADKLIRGAGVKSILDLADSKDEIDGYIKQDDFDSPYFLSLYKTGSVILCDMSVNVYSDEFRDKAAAGLSRMASMGGPYYIHCLEGKDRTGFICMLVEALAGASYEEIVDDYMLTYENYYGITESENKEQYDVLLSENLGSFIKVITGEDQDPEQADLSACARNYLKKGGMTDKEINKLLKRLI